MKFAFFICLIIVVFFAYRKNSSYLIVLVFALGACVAEVGE